eukprot:GHRR01010910.1.p1 GENE.GHRR01010910.1~~GHRR01010910.1.p1  ORF type:complete len:313 (+),score=91.06 GHRR01010910.1:70-1008(+)
MQLSAQRSFRREAARTHRQQNQYTTASIVARALASTRVSCEPSALAGQQLPNSRRRSTCVVAQAAAAAPATVLQAPGQHLQQVNVVYKFGGSSVRDAERMREVADIICSFPENLPCVVLSAMGKTTNMLLECGELALCTSIDKIPSLKPLETIRDLHLSTCQVLGVEPAVQAEVEQLLSNLQQLLIGISIMQDLTNRARDSLVSFGERMSTRIFASYLRQHGVPAQQFDAPEIGVTTTDDFGNADIIYEQTLPAVRAALRQQPGGPRQVQVVTGFLGKAMLSSAITTLGRGGSDLTATLIGAALELKEVQVR